MTGRRVVGVIFEGDPLAVRHERAALRASARDVASKVVPAFGAGEEGAVPGHGGEEDADEQECAGVGHGDDVHDRAVLREETTREYEDVETDKDGDEGDAEGEDRSGLPASPVAVGGVPDADREGEEKVHAGSCLPFRSVS